MGRGEGDVGADVVAREARPEPRSSDRHDREPSRLSAFRLEPQRIGPPSVGCGEATEWSFAPAGGERSLLKRRRTVAESAAVPPVKVLWLTKRGEKISRLIMLNNSCTSAAALPGLCYVNQTINFLHFSPQTF